MPLFSAFLPYFPSFPTCKFKVNVSNHRHPQGGLSLISVTFHPVQGGLPSMAKKVAEAKPLTKTQLYSNIAEATGLTKKQVDDVFQAMSAEIAAAVSKKGAGQITVPGLMKIIRHHKPATKKRQVRNPATGEMVWTGPKPATSVIKLRALKNLKDMV
jgi:nucleoid DNA-binding protein